MELYQQIYIIILNYLNNVEIKMKQIQLSIIKKRILEEVSLHSSYMGVKNSAEISFFNRVSTIKEDETLLCGFWKEACGELAEKFRPYLYSYNLDDSALSVSLETSGAYDDALTPSVVSDSFNAIAFGVLGRWLKIVFPEKSEETINQSRLLLERAYSKLCQRQKPRRNQL